MNASETALALSLRGLEAAPSDGGRLLSDSTADPIVLRQDFEKHAGSECAVRLSGSLVAVSGREEAFDLLATEGRTFPETIEARGIEGSRLLVLRAHGSLARDVERNGLRLQRGGFVVIRSPVHGNLVADLPEWLADASEPDHGPIKPCLVADVGEIRSVTFAELDAMKLPPRELIVEPWLGRAEQTAITGPKSRGKSFVTLGLASVAAASGRLWRWRAPNPLRVLLIDGEMGRRRVQERIRLFRETCDLDRDALRQNLHVVTPDLQTGDLFNLTRPEGRAAVERHVERLGGVDLLIFDNVSVLYRGRDLNKEESWGDWQEWLLRWRRFGVASHFALHVGKDEGRGGRSHSKYRDILDAEIQIGTPPQAVANGLHFSMKFTAVRDYGHDMGPVEIRLTEAKEWIVGGLSGESASRNLWDSGAADLREAVAKELGRDPSISRRRCARNLREKGMRFREEEMGTILKGLRPSPTVSGKHLETPPTPLSPASPPPYRGETGDGRHSQEAGITPVTEAAAEEALL